MDRPLNVVVLVQDQARGVVVGVFGVGHVGPVHDMITGVPTAAAPFKPMVREPGARKRRFQTWLHFTIGDQDDIVDPHAARVEQVGVDRDGADVILPGGPERDAIWNEGLSKHATILKQSGGRCRGRKNQKIVMGFSNPCPRPGSSLGLLLDLNNGTVSGQQQARDGRSIL